MALSGTATIAAGDTTETVTHTYGAIPPAISLEPQTNLNGRSYWVTSKTTTTFVINISSIDFETAHVFAWAIGGITEYEASGDQYCTVAKAKDAIGLTYEELGYMDDDAYETAISNTIDRASRLIDRYCNRPTGFFNGGATQTDYFDAQSVNSAAYAGTNRYANRNDAKREYHLTQTPVISITSVYKNTADIGSNSWVAITSYRSNLTSGRIIIASGSEPDSGYENLRVIYECGYSTVPDEVRYACEDLVGNAYKKAHADYNNSRIRLSAPRSIMLGGDQVFTQDIKDRLAAYRKVHL